MILVRKLLKLKSSRNNIAFFFCFFFVMGIGYEVNANVISTSEVGVFEIGSFVKLKQDLNLRDKPGGEKIDVLLKGDEAQVVSTFKSLKGDRYYQIFVKGQLGYIFSGDETNYSSFVEQTWRSRARKFIAKSGDRVRIKNPFGLSLRFRPGSKKRLTIIPPGMVLTVQSVVQGKDSKVYYKVKHRSYKGFIYAGNLEKKKSVLAWTKVL